MYIFRAHRWYHEEEEENETKEVQKGNLKKLLNVTRFLRAKKNKHFPLLVHQHGE